MSDFGMQMYNFFEILIIKTDTILDKILGIKKELIRYF